MKKFKNAIALMMAVLMVSGEIISAGPVYGAQNNEEPKVMQPVENYTVTPSVTTPEPSGTTPTPPTPSVTTPTPSVTTPTPPVTTPPLPEHPKAAVKTVVDPLPLIDGTGLGRAAALKIKAVDNGTHAAETGEIVLNLNSDGTIKENGNVELCTKCKYVFKLTSENYMPVSGDVSVDTVNNTAVITVDASKMIPDYKLDTTPVINGRTALVYGETESYSLNMNQNWLNHLTWEVISNSSTDLIQADGENHVYNITAGGGGNFDLAAKLDGTQVSVLHVNVSKKVPDLTLNVDEENCPWDKKFTAIAILKDGDKPLEGKEIKVSVTPEVLIKKPILTMTDGSGKVVLDCYPLAAKTYKITASYTSDDEFYDSTEIVETTYTAKKVNVILKNDSPVEMDYGTADATIDLNEQLKAYKQNGTALKAADIVSVKPAKHTQTPCADVTINKKNGTIVVKNLKAGKEQISLEFETNDYTFTEIIDVTVNKYPLKIDTNSVHTGTKNGTDFNDSKVYDGTNDIAVSVDIDDASLNNLTEENKNKITNKNLIFNSLDSGVKDVKDKTVEDGKGNTKKIEVIQDITIQLSLDASDFYDKENFYLENGKDVAAKLKVLKKELTLAVADNSRPYRSNQYVTPLTVTAAGFIEGETDLDKKDVNFKFPVIVDDTLKVADVSQDTARCKTHKGALGLKENTGNPTDNYKFYFGDDPARYKKGNLTVTEEKIKGTDKKYVSIDNDSSKNVFQKEDKIYFGNGTTSEDHAVARFTLTPDSGYNTIYIDGVKVNTENGLEIVPTAGMVSGDVITKTIYLSEESDADMLHRTEEFSIQFIYDMDAPECASISFGTADKVISDFTSAITFGLYSRVAVEASVSIDEKKEISGLNNWTYCVVDIDQDQKYQDRIDEYLSTQQFIKPEEDQDTIVVGALHKGETLTENNNFVVYVRTEDQVGNARIFGSNGIILEDNNDISVQYTINDGPVKNYYKDSVNLKIAAQENGEIYSGLKQIDYSVTINGSDPSTVQIYQPDAGTTEPEKWIPEDVTLEQLKKYCNLETTKDFEVSTSESKAIVVSASSTDYAENTMSTPATCSFVVDGVKPVITSKLYQRGNGGNFRNTRYANSNVVYEVTVKERYLDYNSIKVTINGVERTLEELISQSANLGIIWNKDEIPDITTTTDDSEYKFTLEFTKDGEYDISTKLADYAGNQAGDSSRNFIIDTVNPEIQITYSLMYNSGATKILRSPLSSREYANEEIKNISITPVIIEDNFPDSGEINGSVVVEHSNDGDKTNVSQWAEELSTQYKKADSWEENGIDDKGRKKQIQRNLNIISMDAEYTFTYNFTDLAGNPADIVTDHITYDATRPTGSITVDNMVNGESSKQWINTLVKTITFGLFGKESIGTEMTAEDITSGIASQQYLLTDKAMDRSQLIQASGWNDYKGKLKIDADQSVIVYEKVVDEAGNIECFSSDGIIVDNTIDAPSITITPSEPAWRKNVYSASDHPGFKLEVTDPENGGTYSGLHEVTYTITNETNRDFVTETVTFEKSDHQHTWSAEIAIDPVRFYSNNVKVTAKANDWSQNESSVTEAVLKIDSAAPVVNFSFDRSDVKNGKYFNNSKTLVITVNERNFDPSYVPKVTSTNQGGYSFSGWSSNGETNTGTITFHGDGDYSVSYECFDLAGNKSNTETLDQITIDKSRPELTVSYNNNSVSNGKYYKDSRTATITVVEHNFNPSKISIQASAVTGPAPSISGWSSNGDRHTATVRFGADGEYTLSVSGADLAENAAASYGQDRFIIDLSGPEVVIEGVESQKAYNDSIEPVIKITDTNFSAKDVSVSLKGVTRGDVDLSSLLSTTVVPNGKTYSIQNLPEGMDDIYTLTVTSRDMAGNEENRTVVFSVNRDGSTYVIGQKTKELIDKKFVSAPSDISLDEINVNTLEFIEITYSKDGKVVTLKEGTDFVVTVEEEENGWKKYSYNISSSCFEEEGTYVINIYSEDGAGNTTTNKVKAKTIEFTVDKTAPSMVVSNLINKGRYKEDIHQFTINVKDNIAISSLDLYLDDKLDHTYNADELVEEDGLIKVDLKSSNDYQKVAMVAKDQAGNETKEAYVSDIEGENKNAPAVFSVLVTANTWIQFYMNKPLLISSIIILLLLLLLAAYMIKRKYDKKEK